MDFAARGRRFVHAYADGDTAAGGVGSYLGPPAAAIGPVDDAGLFTDPDRPGSGSAGSHGAQHRSPEPDSPVEYRNPWLMVSVNNLPLDVRAA